MPASIVVTGPTASGKTAVAVELAQRLSGEVINADSSQVYRKFDIGTAKPTPDEQRKVRFHLVDCADPDEAFNAARWKEAAECAVDAIRRRARRVIVCGGTGLYIRALVRGWSLGSLPAVPEIRAALHHEMQQRGAADLYQELERVDPDTARTVHPNNRVRVERALEVFRATGVPLSMRQFAPGGGPRTKWVVFGLDLDRECLYRRIQDRVEAMLARGLVAEIDLLLASGVHASAAGFRSLGYREILQVKEGLIAESALAETITRNTRRYARRQLTWLRAEPELIWITADGRSAADIADEIVRRVERTDSVDGTDNSEGAAVTSSYQIPA
ncbi:MAG: tRNA (adenosine(37)-N6)-dimethylallyltransferase MiaA [Armatimonadetes bacterium]|nr:tRNA (adenosine(37)-N6)-dimethylallyltransferase MiaA [Armatimonadota bacterium]MDE2205425.1 tRNA (adenosine(37)-N6)-dimethylallyltransferase MiaA [Armatimonadota bacterium]